MCPLRALSPFVATKACAAKAPESFPGAVGLTRAWVMGLPDSEFVDAAAISDVLKCPVCFDVFDDPVFCSTDDDCQHAFCRGCIVQHLQGSEQCPTCRAEMQFDDLKSHLLLRNLLDELPVLCPHRCGWTGRRDARNAHRDECPVLKLERAEAEIAAKVALMSESATEARLKSAERELKARDRRIAELEAMVQQLDKDLINVGGKMVESQVRISDLEDALQQRTQLLQQACSRVHELETEICELNGVLQCFQESTTDISPPGSPRFGHTPPPSANVRTEVSPAVSPRFGATHPPSAIVGSPERAGDARTFSELRTEVVDFRSMLEHVLPEDLVAPRNESVDRPGPSQPRLDRGRLPAASPRRPAFVPEPSSAEPPLTHVRTDPLSARASDIDRLQRAVTTPSQQAIDEMMTGSNDLEM